MGLCIATNRLTNNMTANDDAPGCISRFKAGFVYYFSKRVGDMKY